MRSRTEKIMQLAAAAVPARPPSSSPPPQKRRSQQLTKGLGAGIHTPFDCDLEPHETVTASLISSSLKAVMHSESAKIALPLPLPYLNQAIPVIDTSETEKSSFNDVFLGVPPNIDDNMSPCQEPAVGDEQITNERLFSELDEFLAFLPSMSEGDKEEKTQTSLNIVDITEYSEVELNNNLDEDYNQIGGKRENEEKDCSVVPEEDVEHNAGNAFIEEDEEETEGAGRISVEDSHSIEQEDSSSTSDEENVEGAGRISVENNSVAEEDRNDDNVNDEAGFSGKKKRSKKPNSARWMKNANKRKRETGEEYSGVKKLCGKWDYNVVRPAKTVKPFCNCKLSLKSDLLKCRIIGEDVRKQIFDYFWKKLGWKEKQTYVRGLIDISLPKNIKNRENKDNTRRNQTLTFFLRHNSSRVRVCKKNFLNTLCLSDWVVLNWISSSEKDVLQIPESASQDLQLPELPSSSAQSDKPKTKHLHDFLQKLPMVESHYCRKDSKKLYLEPIFTTKTEVYDLYVADCRKQNDVPAVSLKTFYVEFEKSNLSIFKPRKDQCDLCVSYKAGNTPEEDYQHHRTQKELANEEKKNDNSSDSTVLTMDLEAVLLCPKLRASALYYKTKLIVHNFTIYNNKTHDGFCYVWHEAEGGVTANEFASIISSFIENQLKPSPNEEIIIWSDNCGYQNKNSVLGNTLLYLANKLNVTITQKFLERGHTQLECDSIHACIERKLEGKDINVPAQYVQYFKEARKNPSPYQVFYLDHLFFKDYSVLNYFTSIRPGAKAGDPTVSQLKCLKYKPNHQLFYKTDFSDEWAPLEKRRRSTTGSIDGTIKPLYTNPLKIKTEKYKHLQELKKVIFEDYHAFYDNLKH